MRATYLKAFALCIMLCPNLAFAQEKPATPEPTPHHYKLVYRLVQIGADGKVSNSRSYSTIVVADDARARPASIRTGDKLPIQTSGGYQYEDVGTDIDTSQASVHDHQLSLQVSATFSSVVKGSGESSSPPLAPLFRQTKWDSNVVVLLSKPTILFTSDNPTDTGKTELELTATEIDQH